MAIVIGVRVDNSRHPFWRIFLCMLQHVDYIVSPPSFYWGTTLDTIRLRYILASFAPSTITIAKSGCLERKSNWFASLERSSYQLLVASSVPYAP